VLVGAQNVDGPDKIVEAGPEARSSTAERILDAAEELFSERGFAGTAVRDIAARCGLNPASLYNHFPGKQDIYEAVLERGLRPIFELLSELAGPDWTPARDEQATDLIVDHFAQKSGLARLVHHEALAGGEIITRVAARWMQPIYSQGLRALERSPAVDRWEAAELPLLVATFHNTIIGYFAMAPMLEKLLGEDPLSPAALERHKRFVRKVTSRLVGEAGKPPT
jgi:TetR/AcrR family transcriptional regulator